MEQTIQSELEQDAKRYRFLRTYCIYSDYSDFSVRFSWTGPLTGGGSREATVELHRKSLDDAVDEKIRGYNPR